MTAKASGARSRHRRRTRLSRMDARRRHPLARLSGRRPRDDLPPRNAGDGSRPAVRDRRDRRGRWRYGGQAAAVRRNHLSRSRAPDDGCRTRKVAVRWLCRLDQIGHPLAGLRAAGGDGQPVHAARIKGLVRGQHGRQCPPPHRDRAACGQGGAAVQSRCLGRLSGGALAPARRGAARRCGSRHPDRRHATTPGPSTCPKTGARRGSRLPGRASPHPATKAIRAGYPMRSAYRRCAPPRRSSNGQTRRIAAM